MHKDVQSLHVLLLALEDYNSGIERILEKPSDEKMANLIALLKQPLPENLYSLLYQEIRKAITKYSSNKKEYVEFKKQKLQDSQFWKAFMQVNRKVR